MIIKKMTLYNFRQFKDIQTIEFSQDKHKNITLILGDNTSGKTTLLQAFLWCFYGKANFKVKDLINEDVAVEIAKTDTPQEMYITIDLEHQGTQYCITRKQIYSFKNDKVIAGTANLTITYLDASGKTDSIPNNRAKEKINEILPEKLSMYFLYDTERFSNVSSSEDVTESVKRILGLSVLEEMITYLGSSKKNSNVLKQLKSNLDVEDSNQAKDAYQNMLDFEEKINVTNEQIENYRNEIKHYENKINEYQETLRGLEKTAAYQREIDQYNKALELEQGKLESCTRNFYTSFQNNTFSYLGHELFLEAKNELVDAKLDTKTIRDMNANAIKDIIARGYCVCGTEVCEGNNAYIKLHNEMEYLPPESIGTLLKMFKDKLDFHTSNKCSYFTILEDYYKNMLSSQDRIGEIEQDIEQIEKEILSLGQDDIKKYQEDLNAAVKKKNDLHLSIEQLKENLGEYQNEYQKNESKHRRLTLASAKNKDQWLFIKYAQELLKWAKSRKDEREGVIRAELEAKVNHYFSQIYHGNRKVIIDEKFHVHLITTDSDVQKYTDESKGLETVKNFSFISGLVDLAKQKIQNSLESDAIDYPLILDAPFSHADELHVENISNVLPNVANQLILIVMAKDWNYAKDAMSSRIGKEYTLNKQSEIHTIVKGV